MAVFRRWMVFSFVLLALVGCAVATGGGGGGTPGGGGGGGGTGPGTPADTTPPSVALVSPTNGQTFGAPTIHASGTVSDNVGVSSVRLHVTTNNAGFTNVHVASIASNTFEVSNVLLDRGNAAYIMWAIAQDAANNTASTASITVNLNAAVTVIANLQSPIHTTNLTSFTVSGTASATSDSITEVHVSVNGGAFALATGTTSWNRAISITADATNTVQVYARTATTTSATNTYTVVHQGILPLAQGTWGTATWAPGARFSGANEVTIAVFSANATRIVLEIYRVPWGEDAVYRFEMVKGAGNFWRARLGGSGVTNGLVYAFRAWGPNWPFVSSWQPGTTNGFISDVDAVGNRFNPNKVLYDPWAREITHDRNNPTALASMGVDGNVYGTGATLYLGRPRREWDTGRVAPKGYLIDVGPITRARPNVAWRDSIIYRAHPRGLTAHPSAGNLATILSGIAGFENVPNIPAQYRGTYRGAGMLAPYIAALGYTVIDFLPIHETDNDHNPADGPGGNYWGYMTYGFFAPDRRYSSDKSPGGPTREFQWMVQEFNRHGIEVMLDVVYNHTGEGGIWSDANTAELTSFRGFDNREFYALLSATPRYYWNRSGCGNDMNFSRQVVRDLVTNSLVYWMDVMGVDGFRFDLATIMGRDTAPDYHHFNPNAQLLLDIRNITASRSVEIFAEPWDLGTYQAGNFPAGWGEWSGRYRDQVRNFMRGQGNAIGDNADPRFIQVVNGNWGWFNDNGGPHKSVNMVNVHDGFNLMDLVSYNTKQTYTASWPFGPSDGGRNENLSWDSGGDQTFRRQRMRNFLVVQMFSRGIPIAVWGDEFARTQNGNNNPYNIDSVATWNNYNMINTDSPHLIPTGGTGAAYHNNYGTDSTVAGLAGRNDLFLFTRRLVGIRRAHQALRQSDYNVSYDFRKEDGVSTLVHGDRCVWIRIDGSSVAGGNDFLLFVNMWTANVSFTVPAATAGMRWVRIIDTAPWAEAHNNIWDVSGATTITGSYGVNPWSIVVLQEVPN